MVKDIAAAASRALGAQLEMVPNLTPNPAERVVLRLMRDMAPYMGGEPVFDNSVTWPFTSARCYGLTSDFIEATIRGFLGER